MANSSKIYLVYSPTVEKSLNQVLDNPFVVEIGVTIRTVKLAEMASIHVDDDLNHALLWIEQEDYPQALKCAYEKRLSLGFIPINGDKTSQFIKNLDLPSSFNDCLKAALNQEPFPMDLIECNGEIVINGVNLENQTTMSEFIGDSENYTGIHKLEFQIKRFLHAFSLTPHPVSVVTAKGKTVNTAITGMVLLDFHSKGVLLKQFKDSISLRDKRISVVFFAPQSILSYLHLSSARMWTAKKKELQQQIGYIRTESLTIQSPLDTHYLVNGKPLTTRELQLKTLKEGLVVNAGESFRNRQQFADDKENINCKYLPQQEDRIKYLSKTLPFFSHALESDFKDLFLALKENAQINSTYLLLMVLSSLLATLGLFLNSPSVVIGAMVLAPLMAPIISLSMATLRSDADLTRQSFSTLSIGMLTALTLSALMAFLLPFQEVTNEIEGRLHPSTLDLLVAVLSGIAGAFANARENIAKSLPGVAIAVALVPPLCVSGIGVGWLNFEVFYGAMLLFLTNLTGIILAAGLSFLVMGFAPFSRAKKGIFISILLVSIISVPLFLSFKNMQEIAYARNQLTSKKYVVDDQQYWLKNIKIRLGSPLLLSADLMINRFPEVSLLQKIEQQLSNQLNKPVKVDFSIRLVTENPSN